MSLNANARKIIRDATVEVPLAPLLAPLEPLDFGRELNSAVSALSLSVRPALLLRCFSSRRLAGSMLRLKSSLQTQRTTTV